MVEKGDALVKIDVTDYEIEKEKRGSPELRLLKLFFSKIWVMNIFGILKFLRQV